MMAPPKGQSQARARIIRKTQSANAAGAQKRPTPTPTDVCVCVDIHILCDHDDAHCRLPDDDTTRLFGILGTLCFCASACVMNWRRDPAPRQSHKLLDGQHTNNYAYDRVVASVRIVRIIIRLLSIWFAVCCTQKHKKRYTTSSSSSFCKYPYNKTHTFTYTI